MSFYWTTQSELSSPLYGKHTKGPADFSARLPKLNLAGPDLKHAGRRVQKWIGSDQPQPKLDPARGKIYDSLFRGTVEHNRTKCPFVHETAFFGFAITGQIVKFTKSFQGNPKLDSQDEVTNRYAIDQQAQN